MSKIIMQLFLRCLNMSLTAGIIILAVLAVRVCLKQAPKIFSYALWAVVLFRLLCPFSFTSHISLMGILHAPVAEQGQITYIRTPDGNAGWQPGGEEEAIPESTGTQTPSLPEVSFTYERKNRLLSVGAGIWALGIAVVLGCSAISFFKFKSRLKGAVLKEKGIYESAKIETPVVCGICRPAIYLPEGLKEHEKNYIILHEKIHIRRGDPIIRMLAFFVLALYWFHPLVWVAFILSGKDMEMSCDEAVIRKIGNEAKKEYSASLLNLATGRNVIRILPPAFGEGDTRSRIKNVLRYKKSAAVFIGITVIACVAAAFFLLGNPGSGKENTGVSADATDSGQQKDIVVNSTIDTDTPELHEFMEEGNNEASLPPKEETQTKQVVPINIRTLQKEERLIDTYVGEDISSYDGGEPLVLAEDCVFWVNYNMAGIVYEEVSYDTFADLIAQGGEFLNKPAVLTFEDGMVAEIALENNFGYYGIFFREKTSGHWWYEDMQEIAGEDMLKQYYTLVRTETGDIADAAGEETIEVYTGNIGDGESGFVIFYDAQGNMLYTEFAHQSRMGWNNIYLGELPQTQSQFIMTAAFEDRDTFGGFGYEVFRLSETGEIRQIAGSSFEWGDSYVYDEKLFTEWADDFFYYMENSYLLLSSQDGEIRTEKVSDADKYNVETLREMCTSME